MSIEDFLPLMPDTVWVSERVGQDTYGVPQYGSPVAYRARVVYREHRVRAGTGEEKVARGTVWIAGTPAITAEDQIELPDGRTPPVLSVDRFSDERGVHHVVVHFG